MFSFQKRKSLYYTIHFWRNPNSSVLIFIQHHNFFSSSCLLITSPFFHHSFCSFLSYRIYLYMYILLYMSIYIYANINTCVLLSILFLHIAIGFPYYICGRMILYMGLSQSPNPIHRQRTSFWMNPPSRL